MSRTYRHPFTGGKRFSHACANHGSCSWCRDNRTYNERRDGAAADNRLREYLTDPFSGGDFDAEREVMSFRND